LAQNIRPIVRVCKTLSGLFFIGMN
jgi:hypothetical protein